MKMKRASGDRFCGGHIAHENKDRFSQTRKTKRER